MKLILIAIVGIMAAQVVTMDKPTDSKLYLFQGVISSAWTK